MNRGTVLSELLRYINSVQRKDSNYDIALKLVTHYNQIEKMTINELADLCYVSPASVTRFIKTLGFDTYKDFKKKCSDNTNIVHTDYSLEVSKAKKEDLEPIFNRYCHHVIENIKFISDNIDYDQMDRICRSIYDSDDIAMLGLEFSTIIGLHFQSRMALMNKYIKIGFSHEEQSRLVETLSDNAVVIIATIEGGYYYWYSDVVDKLLQKHAKIIVLTMNLTNKMIKEAEEVLICNKENNDTEGRISLLYTIELIIMYYCINYSYI